MRCDSCGNQLPEDAVYCNNCGQKVVRSNRERSNSTRNYVIIAITAAVLLIIGVAAAVFGYMYHNNSIKDDGSKTAMQMTASPEPTNTPSAAAPTAAGGDVNIAKLETYYAVNCDKSISLWEAADTSSGVLKQIPLGDPVSYVEPAQNGFAKVIYMGTTGYALQSYLSNNPEDIKRADSGNTSADKSNESKRADRDSAADNQKTRGVVNYPGYNTYTDSAYDFSCIYPEHFIKTSNSDPFVRRSYKAADNTASLNICGTDNKSNLSAKTVQDNFKSSYPGTIDYENRGDDWCVCRTYKGGVYHYGYFKIKDGMIRGFEMHFDGEYYTVYDGYVNDIYNSLEFN